MKAASIILALFASEEVAAEELWVPRLQPKDVRITQVIDDGTLLVQSGTTSFVCRSVEEDEAFVFGECKAVLPQFAYAQLQFEALAREEDVRLKSLQVEEIDLATTTTLREHNCLVEIGSLDSFSTDALTKIGIGYGLSPDIVPFARVTVEELGRASLDRLFSAGEVSYLDNRSKVSLKDCP